MDFLTTLQTDVKLLLVCGALALLAGLFSGSKKNEHRYTALFTILMVAAGVRFHFEQKAETSASSVRTSNAATHTKAPGPRSTTR